MLPIIVAALIPTIVGFLYYHPKAIGGHWMQALGKSEEELQEGFNMVQTIIISLVLSFLLAFAIDGLTEGVHKDGSFHTFQHGALHGALLAIFIIVPVLITNGMYERRSWKLMLINCGYWIITFALMGGLTDAWN